MVSFLYKTTFFTVFLSLIFTGLSPVYAVQINQLYSATVPLASQQKQDRRLGFDLAFELVLIKASGQFDKVTQPKFLETVLPAEPFVQTFSYRENPAYQEYLQAQLMIEEADLPVESDGDAFDVEVVVGTVAVDTDELSPELIEEVPPLPYLLDVSFEPSIVEAKMAELGVPIWGSVRPSVLVWLVREHEGERTLVGTSDAGELVEPLLSLGELRGVPLYLPVADLQDVSAVNVDDIWGLFPESVDLASERYRADAVVMMRVYQSDSGLWSGNWLLNLKQSFETGSRYDSELPELLESLVSDLAGILSSRYAVSKLPGEQGSVLELEVSQINSFADYVEIQRYLTELPPVASMTMKWVRSGRAAYQVTLIGSKDQFFEHVDLGGRLRKDLSTVNKLNTDRSLYTDSVFKSLEQSEQELFAEEQVPVLDQLSSPKEYYIWSSGKASFAPTR